jgi:DNA segregation ATPase FtsK/SpoIIIE, S-DNA-T family
VKPQAKRAGLRTGSQPVVAVLDRGLVYQERLRIPLSLSILGLTLRGLFRAVAGLLHLAYRYPVPAAVVTATAVLWLRLGAHGLAVVAVAAGLLLAAVLVGWQVLLPASFSCFVAEPARGWWHWQTRYRRRWREAMDGCGLIVKHDETEYLPQVHRIRGTRWTDTLRVRLAAGQTPSEVAEQAEALAHVFEALRATVRADAPGFVIVRFYTRDPLVDVVQPAPLPDLDGTITGEQALDVLRSLEVARAEDGTPWLLNLVATHVLIAGATGAGKASFLWSVIRLLLPLVRAGLVALWVIDPKGGMEFRMGQAFFTRYEDTNRHAMVEMVEGLADDMDARTARLAGHVRSHVPTVADPFVVLIVDEVADLTAHNPDKGLAKRMTTAIARLQTKGRAPGYAVITAAVDPRKEVVTFRDLTPTRVAMRMSEPEQTDLTLGDKTVERGTDASLIPRTLPGVAYVRDDNAADPAPVRVRFTYLDDDTIRALVQQWLAEPTRDITAPSGTSDRRAA